MSPDVVEQASEISRSRGQHAEKSVIPDGRNDRVAFLVLDQSDESRSFSARHADLVRGSNDSGHPCCQTFSIESDCGLTVDQKPVATEYYNGLDAGPLANGDCEVANGRHQSSVKGVANLNIGGNLVNRIRLNCHDLQGIIDRRIGTAVHFLKSRL